MKVRRVGISLVVLCLLAGAGFAALSGDDGRRVRTRLIGFQEVPSNSTVARGEFEARLHDDRIDFELSYEGLEAPVTQAHIHIGQLSVNGGIAIFFCSNLPNPPAGTPACPQSGTVTGTRAAADVIGPNGQGIAPGEFAEVLRAIRAGKTYANVHTTKFPGGEIRGQIRSEDHDE